MHELLAHGADVNIRNNAGWTPLMIAILSHKFTIMRLLCDAPGTDLFARDSRGKTALGWALFRKSADVAAFLLSRGAPE